MDKHAKIRPLYLLKILKEKTDEEHTLTTGEICKLLSDEYNNSPVSCISLAILMNIY